MHYMPVHLQPYYATTFGYKKGECPQAEAYYEHAITIPLHPGMTDEDASYVINTVVSATNE